MWHYTSNHIFASFKKSRNNKGLSERAICQKASISRVTLRSIENTKGNLTLHSISQYAAALELEWGLYTAQEEAQSDLSTIATCMNVEKDGFESWTIHYMNFVDEFRRTLDMRLILLPPPTQYPLRLKALLASIVLELCAEAESLPPSWAQKSYVLSEPWFLSESESLKASALVESPVFYKKNNIFVLENFLKRA